jgi:hypothetical protein
MSARPLALVLSIVALGSALCGCAAGPGTVAGRSDAVAGNGIRQRPETRAERYARGEYRRGFGRDADRNAAFCQLNPADTDCIGRRF